MTLAQKKDTNMMEEVMKYIPNLMSILEKKLFAMISFLNMTNIIILFMCLILWVNLKHGENMSMINMEI